MKFGGNLDLDDLNCGTYANFQIIMKFWIKYRIQKLKYKIFYIEISKINRKNRNFIREEPSSVYSIIKGFEEPFKSFRTFLHNFQRPFNINPNLERLNGSFFEIINFNIKNKGKDFDLPFIM